MQTSSYNIISCGDVCSYVYSDDNYTGVYIDSKNTIVDILDSHQLLFNVELEEIKLRELSEHQRKTYVHQIRNKLYNTIQTEHQDLLI